MDARMFYTWMSMLAFWTILGYASTQTAQNRSISNEALTRSFQTLKEILRCRLLTRLKVSPKYYAMPIPIIMYHEPLQIIEVDEIFQAITLSSTVTIKWKDPNIGWDPVNFSNIEVIDLQADLFWTPTVLVPKATQKNALQLKLPKTLYVSYDGYVSAYISTFINSLCNFDMTSFPFDKHNCSFVFLERNFYNLTFQKLPSRDISKNFETNAAWMLLTHGCSRTTTQSISPPFDYITCYVQMSRHSAFFVANLIAPMLLTSVMTLIVFWIPAEDGEKISFLVAIFTSTSVFLNYIVDMIPRSMETIPSLNFLLFAIDLQVILATVATAVVLRRYKQEEEVGHHPHQQISIYQEWFRRLYEYLKKNTPTRNIKENQSRKGRFIFLSRKNIVYPKVNAITEVSTLETGNQNCVTRDGSTCRYEDEDYERNITSNASLFCVDLDVPGPSEYISPHEENNHHRGCMGSRRFTHEELDKLFFVLMLMITIAVYIYAFV